MDKFDLLTKIASTLEPVGNSRIAAGIFYKNNLISLGTCKYKSHPFQKRFGKHSEAIYLHAEIEAIKLAIKELDTTDLQKYQLYIARTKIINNKFVWGLAKPCIGCQRAIATFNIKDVYYTTNTNFEYAKL